MEYRNLLEVLAHHAKTQPQKIALSLLNSNDIDQIDDQLTYSQLFQSAYYLSKQINVHTKPGDRAILCYPTGIDFVIAFYACLFAKVIAVPVFIPSNLGLIKKFSAVYNDCNPALVLTDHKTLRQCSNIDITKHSDHFPALKLFQCNNDPQVQVLVTNDIVFNSPPMFFDVNLPSIKPNELAFLQYTSGSTASPKGVMISHGNLMNNINAMNHAFGIKEDTIILSWLPHTHDMGLIGYILYSTYLGGKLFLMSPMAFIRRPLNWLQALSTHEVNNLACPCFALKMCLEHVTPENIKGLDLSHINCFIVGSEPISYSVVNDFFKTLASTGLSEKSFVPAYGLAESTLMVSSRFGLNLKHVNYFDLNHNKIELVSSDASHSTKLVSCGRPYQLIKIVSPKTTMPCNEKEVGEIWLRDQSTAQGYWQKDEENNYSFQARLANDEHNYFRTGDLGFLYEGELYIVGRLKEVIIINGANYYPQDIEQTVLLCDEALYNTSCAVFRHRTLEAVTDSFVILIKQNSWFSDEMKIHLQIKIRKQILKEYQLIPHDIQFVNFNFPKTTSGKLQRNACNQLYINHYKHEQERDLYAAEG